MLRNTRLTSDRFYRVKLNKIGIQAKSKLRPMIMFSKEFRSRRGNNSEAFDSSVNLLRHSGQSTNNSELSIVPAALLKERRTVLIATMEYDIEDWAIKVKIGGLGVMAQLMGKNRKLSKFFLTPFF
jgi:alpha-1,3-glucan synthase